MSGDNVDPAVARQEVENPELQRTALDFLNRPRTDQDPAVGRPSVTIPGGAMTITESAEALFKAIAPHKQLFYRGGLVVELVREQEGHGVQVLDPVSAQSRFEKYVNFFKTTKIGERYVPTKTTISEAIAKQYIKSEACRSHLPKLNGVLHCPLLMERDGQLHRIEQGYDDKTGFFITGSQATQTVNLHDAVEMLSGLLNDFDFVTPGDRSRAIASMLTPALKLGGFIKGAVPIDVAEANASQSGKTYRQKMVMALYNQHPAVVTKKGGGVGSLDETFADHLAKGRTFIQFDNVRGKLDSQYLEAFMTATGPITARIPHHGNIMVDPSKFIVFISSNGFEATKDLSNRASIIRIRRRVNHHYRMLGGNDVLQLTFLWQPILMGAIFAVIEEWFRQGKPKTTDTRHDFREWCQTLDWIAQNIFQEAPLMDGHEEAKERAANPQLTFVRTVAIALNEKGRLNQPITASDLADLCLEEDIEMPGLGAEHQTVEAGRKNIGRILGKLFEERDEVVLEDFRVGKEQATTRSAAGNEVNLNRYTFSLIEGEPQAAPDPAPHDDA